MTPHRLLPTTLISLLLLAGCAATEPAVQAGHRAQTSSAQDIAMLERVSWGVNGGSVRQVQVQGWNAYLQAQLHPGKAALPPAIAAQIDAMTISQVPLDQLVFSIEQKRKESAGVMDDMAKQQAQKEYQQELNRLAREAATRSLLLDVYSPNQLQQQLSWFWLNHFSVHQGKHNLRAMVGDYEANAIAPHALGKFRDLLGATVHHPAMLRYLDNEANAAKRINENYARELMELHTLGVNGGYSQADVQELARILTGVGVNLGADTPKVKPALQSQYVRRGLFEFNPNRHDYGDKQFLGQTVKGRGLAELDEALDRLSRSPATAHFISGKLAQYFVGDNPPAPLVARMAATFQQSDGMIADVLQTMFSSPEFKQSLGKKFKDPMHYVVSAVRLSYDDKPILNAGPMLSWLSRMGQPLYGRQTPDGYPLADASWASPGQMTTRFDIARTIGSGSAGLFKTDGPQPQEKVAFPQLASALYYQSLQPALSPATRLALEQAASPQEWNTFLLSSPEMMHR
ncbi:DUF1800 domain-containing protein [Janthinobacterium sp. PLB04]|uniref:DUF1800 domain-containing protein n=1 Tax=Janthinobacterium lividum TaxID=29581 RepID=A0AAJ4T724_9BURK|nr:MULTISPECIES: DUF1800 domain-containing protein [Janthinobacterium]KAB0331949.1 DUF1800 domain-containing protein [Janthinobacterium lividum]QSX98148.1 DUF1800 domain-containing protein [Janthinobacterium lividum]UGQ38128.1 DUF1800 domain-containing protein [Janthinobacterium sp. PLB04]